MEIIYLKGDATSPQSKGIKLIAHICNDSGRWGKGFVLAVSKRWIQPEAEYRRWYIDRANNDFCLGNIQIVKVESFIYVANMIGQKGTKTGSNGVPIRYDAVYDCLVKLAAISKELKATVHMPRIGCGLAGGKWEKIEPIILNTLIKDGIETWVYDF